MYRITCLLIFVVLFQLSSSASANEAELRSLIESYVAAFNKHDSEAVSAFWYSKGTHVDAETGTKTLGRDAIREDLEAVFAERASMQLSGQINSIRLIKPNVGMIEGVAILTVGEQPSKTSFIALVVRESDKWLIDTLTEMPLSNVEPQEDDPTLSAAEHLKVLDWLEGRWVDESEDGQVDIEFRWSPNRNFLIHSTLSQTIDGAEERSTQVIGWDERSQQIRSWTFNSDGSFGDAVWFASGDNWLIKSSQSLANGDAASGTFVLSRVEEDEISLQLIGHEEEGSPEPSSMSVSVFRVEDAETDARDE